MEQALNTTQPNRIDYYPQDDGKALVILRENIRKDYYDSEDGTSVEFWRSDEVKVETDLPESEIEANFDALWAKAETSSKTLEERVAELESLQDITMGVVLEGGEA